jgi:glycosyltransferase involved in cell wall biosynthesis
VDVILQFGATFEVVTSKTPIVLYCDGNIANSKRAMAVGQSEAAFLTAREIEGVLERERRVYAGAARILTLSERLRQSFIEDFQIPEERVRTIFAGPNFDVTRIPSPSSKVRPGPPTVLFVGRQFQRKGGDILLEAFRLLKQRLPDARLVIVGPTDLSVDISGVEMLGLLDKSTPDGWAALRKAYESAHVFCMPTRYEGFGISFLEAMYFGLPCVSTFTEWWQPEMIVDGETGLIVPLEDVEALCEAMLSLLTNPEKARAMGMAGRKRAEEIFHWPAVIDRMCEELRAAADSVGSGRELDACSER